MGRKPKHIVQAEINNIRRMMDDHKQDQEIADTLNITTSGLYKLKAKIWNQDKESWAIAAKESLEARAFKIMEVLENCYHINKQIAEDRSKQDKDRIEASQIMVQAQINIFQLLKQGPTFRLQLPYKIVEAGELPGKVQYPRAAYR